MAEPQRASEHLTLAGQLFEALSTVRRQVRRRTGRPWPPGALSGSQIELVRLVRREPDLPVSAAAERLGLAGNTVSTLVRQLVDAGVLQRAVDPGDRRVARLTVTAAARRRIEGWRDRRLDSAARALARLDAADRAALAHAVPALDRLATALQELEDDA